LTPVCVTNYGTALWFLGMDLLVKRLSTRATLPTRGSAQAAGYDLSSAVDGEVVIPAGGRALVPTDLSIAVPPGHYGRVAARSGLGVRHGIDVGAGVIDEDYRGAVSVLLFNHGSEDFAVRCGDRVAQLILERISTPEVVEVADLVPTDRGAAGFGSTGVRPVVKFSTAEEVIAAKMEWVRAQKAAAAKPK